MKAVIAALAASLFLCGCVSMVVGTAVLAADVAVGAAVGAVKLTGKAVGAAADIVIPDSKEEKK